MVRRVEKVGALPRQPHQGDLSKRELAHGANSAKSLRDLRVPLDPPKLLWQGFLDGFYLWIEGKSSEGCHSLRKGDVKVCGSLVRYAAGPIPPRYPLSIYDRGNSCSRLVQSIIMTSKWQQLFPLLFYCVLG